MIGRLHNLIVDCPDPEELAGFWSALLGLPVTHRSPDFVVVVSRDEQTSGMDPAGHPFRLRVGGRGSAGQRRPGPR